jgi:cardiolipin synthase
MLLIFPIAYFFISDFENSRVFIAFLIAFVWLTDISDGFIARKFNMISETGKIIDPLADKIVVAVIALLAYYKELLPLWFFILIIARDLVILIFGLFLKKKKGKVLMSNFPGKAAVFSIGLILLFSVINNELFNNAISFLILISVILIVYSSFLYFKRFLNSFGDN